MAKSTGIPNFSAWNICINQRKKTHRKNIVWSELFWHLTERGVVILYGRFGTTRRSHLQGLPFFKTGQDNLFVPSWRWGQQVVLKRRRRITTLRCVRPKRVQPKNHVDYVDEDYDERKQSEEWNGKDVYWSITGNYKTMKASTTIISDPYNLRKSFKTFIVNIFWYHSYHSVDEFPLTAESITVWVYYVLTLSHTSVYIVFIYTKFWCCNSVFLFPIGNPYFLIFSVF